MIIAAQVTLVTGQHVLIDHHQTGFVQVDIADRRSSGRFPD